MLPVSSPLSTTSAGLPWRAFSLHCKGIHLRCGGWKGRGQRVRRAEVGLGSLHPFHRQSVSCWPCGATCGQSRRSKDTRCGTTSTWLLWIPRRPSRCASRCPDSSSSRMPCYPSDPVPGTLPLIHFFCPLDLFCPLDPLPIPKFQLPITRTPFLCLRTLSAPLLHFLSIGALLPAPHTPLTPTSCLL